MFTKKTLKNLFAETSGHNFIISTDIPHGHGINGVDYSSYLGFWSSHDGKYFEKTNIVRFDDDYVLLKSETLFENGDFNNGRRLVCLPYERITSVEFLESETRRHGMPKYLPAGI